MTAETYYRAALERIKDAYLLHTEGHYTFAMYASGLAVECLLRAFRLLQDTSFDERHDLWQLWKKTELANVRLGLTYQRIYALMNAVHGLWRNSFRFVSISELHSQLRKSHSQHGMKNKIVKHDSKRLFDAAQELLQIGEHQWERLKKK